LHPESNCIFENLLGSKTRVRILSILASEGELSITSIINRARTNYKNAVKHLELLKACNLIEEHKFGRIRIFRYRSENFKARAFSQFIEIWEARKLEENVRNRDHSSHVFY